MKTTTIFSTLLVMVFVMTSCGDKETQLEKDTQLIEAYIDENGLDALSTASGLYYVIEEPGNDEHPEFGDVLMLKYTGRFLDEEVFDSSNGNVITLQLKNLIQGWLEGIPLFGKGGKGILLIPSHLAYGPTGSQSGAIRPNTVILFDIELEDFN